ncbi:MAG: hypothetical protein ABSG71_07105 [Thermodesulfobacteriota bacterium]|jgi:hypothetical protein
MAEDLKAEDLKYEYDTLLDGTGFPEKDALHLSPLPHLGRGMG